MSQKNRTFNFVLVLDGFSLAESEVEDALHEAGCDDAILVVRGGIPSLEFDREAASLQDAVLSAMVDVERANVGTTVVRVEPDDLVSAAEIARRTGTSRESIRLWREGERGPDTFPPPVASVGTKTTLWSWAEVSAWLSALGKIADPSVVEEARFLATINAFLNEQRYSPLVSKGKALREKLTQSGVLGRLKALAQSVDRGASGAG